MLMVLPVRIGGRPKGGMRGGRDGLGFAMGHGSPQRLVHMVSAVRALVSVGVTPLLVTGVSLGAGGLDVVVSSGSLFGFGEKHRLLPFISSRMEEHRPRRMVVSAHAAVMTMWVRGQFRWRPAVHRWRRRSITTTEAMMFIHSCSPPAVAVEFNGATSLARPGVTDS